MSRDVDASSANGAKPQSSVVPNDAARYVLACEKNAVPDLLRGLDTGIDRIGHADEHDLIRPTVLTNDPEHPLRIGFARQLDIETPHAKLEQRGEQAGIVDIGAVRRVAIAPRARVHADPLSLLLRKVIENAVVQGNELFEEPAGAIELEREAPFREVDLHAVRPLVEASPDIRDGFAHQVGEKGVTWIRSDP